jgi:uncharacterized protein (TIGR02246 family)
MRKSSLLAMIVAATTLTGAAAATPDRAHRSCQAQQATVRDVPQRVIPAWANEDPDAFARVFTADASFIVPGQDTYLRSRKEIRSYMRELFATTDFRATAQALDVRCLSRDVGIVITEGGLLLPGETEVPRERIGRQTWTIVRQGHDWYAASYHNSRITPG